jgi:thiol-disulfide isomerase/thioredoxin
MAERIIWLVLVLALGAGLYFYLQKPEPPAAENQSFKEVVQGRLPDDWAIADLDGKEITVRELRGKVIFLNHWATWCGPCVGEMPSIQALYDSLRGSDVAFVILSREKPEAVRAFLKDKNWSLPMYIAVEGMPPILQTEGIPATFIINRKGEVVFGKVGAPREGWDTDAVRAMLKKVS